MAYRPVCAERGTHTLGGHMLTMLSTYADHYRARYGSEDGATAVEYGIMVTLIAVVIIAAVWLIGNRLQASFETVADCLEDTTVSC